MIDKLSQSRSWQLILVTALILVVPLTVDINRRISVVRRMRQEETRLSQEIKEAWEENKRLKAQLALVNEPAFVERWARVEARMTRPNEVAIIPVYDERSQPVATDSDGRGSISAAETPPSIPEQWHRLFFGEPANP